MNAFLRKSCLMLKPNPSIWCNSPAYFYVNFQNLCTSIDSQPSINHKISNILVAEHNFAPEFASRLASKLNHVKRPENAGLILSFLKDSGFSDSQLEKMVRNKPRYLSASLEGNIKPKIKFFQDMGISSDDLPKIFSLHPGIMGLSLNENIIPSLSLLKCFLGSDDEVARVLRYAPRIVATNLNTTMLPNIKYLKSCGVSMERILMILTCFPNVLLLKPEALRKSVEKVKEMGLDASCKSFIYAVPAIASMSSRVWKLKLQAFRSSGFSDSDVMTMFRKAPSVFSISTEKVEKISKLVLGTKKYTLSSIVRYPKSLQASIEKRLMPRLQILRNLESRSLIEDWPSLAVVSMTPDDKFILKFVLPYSDKVNVV